MKRSLFILAMLAVAAAIGAQTITLAHGKVEIDKPFKAYAEAWGKANNVEVVIKTLGGGGNDLATELKADYAAGDMPDIFSVGGADEVNQWSAILADLSGEKWVSQTSVPYKKGGKVVGFPVAVEGWGMAYNADVLAKAGVDPAKLNNLAAYKAAFAKLDAQKDKLGLKSVVSMAASMEMFWVTAHHNVNSYLSNGLKFGDTSVVDKALAGQVDAKRLAEYADWVELLFKYADKAVLTTGNYDAQVAAFTSGKAAFIHQGNWIDPNLKDAKVAFKTAFAPHGSMSAATDGIFVNPPSWYVVNKDSKNLAAAKKFLNDLVFTEAGQKFQVVDAGMIPAFNNIKLKPTGPLSQSVQDWAAKGKIYSWNQYYLPNDFRNDALAPIYNQFASGSITKAQFIDLFAKAIATLKK
jgi:raffinose/stachyose/melibiose transport system substrate-binding protein